MALQDSLGKALLSSKQETGTEKSALGLGEATASENPAGAGAAAKNCDGNGSACSTFWLLLRCMEQKQS